MNAESTLPQDLENNRTEDRPNGWTASIALQNNALGGLLANQCNHLHHMSLQNHQKPYGCDVPSFEWSRTLFLYAREEFQVKAQ